MKKAIAILSPILLCFFVGSTASLFQQDAIQVWYPFLNKSTLTPPSFVFPIAWSLIYVCMGASVGLVYLSDSSKRKELIQLFALQLFFNFAWSFLFFYFKNPLLGFIDILILDALVTIYVIKSYAEHRVSSILFWPYMVWIYFATYLNGYILVYN